MDLIIFDLELSEIGLDIVANKLKKNIPKATFLEKGTSTKVGEKNFSKKVLETMKTGKSRPRAFKAICILGSILLLVMAMIHGSGFSYVSQTIMQSNAEEFLKEIVPVLFAHPSIHLIGLAAFGILALFLGKESKYVLFLLSLIIITDGLLAFYLGGVLPGTLLSISALCFAVAGFGLKKD